MRKFLILPVAMLLFACAEETPNYTLLSGNFENLGDGKVNIYDHNDTPTLIAVNEDGSFTDTLSIENAGYYNLRVGRKGYKLFLAPGDRLTVASDIADKDAKPVYTGTAAAANNYLLEKIEIEAKETVDMPSFFAKEEADFLTVLDGLKSKQEEALNTSTASENFKAIEAIALNFERAERLAMYPNYHPHFAKKQEFEVSENFLADVEAINMDDNQNALLYPAYRNLLYMDYSKELYESKDTVSTYIDQVLKMVKTKTSPKVKDVLILNSMYFFNSNAEDLEGTKNELLAETSGEALKEMINKKYDKIKNLTKGKPSPVFDYENFKGGNTALADLKGKYVYIDVWATWCGPCIGEIPSLQKMEHEFEGKNIEFVSISIDEKPDYQKWRTMVTDKELGGTQLMSDNAWKSKFVEEYAIEGIPRFILLDPEGNIVSADADRPSNPSLAETFKELGLK